MYSLRPPAIIASFLIIAILIPQPLFSQTASRQSQPRRRDDALAAAIKELLKFDPRAEVFGFNPDPRAPLSPIEKTSGENASEDKDKPPADDAPIMKLIDYWSAHGDDGAQAPRPSDRVRQRLLEACEDRPESFLYPEIFPVMDCLPENADTHDRLYKLLNEETGGKWSWKYNLQTWMRRNTAYFRDDLIKAARAADDHEYDANKDLRALARLDWNSARPILETMASEGKAFVTPLALTLLYEHSAQEGDSALRESYRVILKAIVENRQANWNARVETLASLMNTEWSGQEEWLISLFADPTLGGFQDDEVRDASAANDVPAPRGFCPRREFQPGILATALYETTFSRRNMDWRLSVIVNLLGHNQRKVHNAAVKCLVDFLIKSGFLSKSGEEKKREEIARKLIPWLTEPNWAAKEVRAEFIRSLTGLNMPELAPELIWILDHDEDPCNRAAAAEALTKYRDPRAIPALRRALEKEKGEESREEIVTALVECGGLSDDEMTAAIEAYARMTFTVEGAQEIDRVTRINGADKALPLDLKVGVGRTLRKLMPIPGAEGLAVRLFERAKALRATEPAMAREILSGIEFAPLRAARINLVERIGEGAVDSYSIVRALEDRAALREGAGDELYGFVKQGGYAAGVAAAILNDGREWKAALKGRDAKAKLALLACARLLRDKLPVELVGELLYSPNRALANAAESYLEVEDSPEARKLILSRHPGEAYIVGDITTVDDKVSLVETVRSWEDALRKELLGRNGLEAIYAVAYVHQPAEYFTGVIIRVRSGKAEMSVHETEGRRNVRLLTEGEFEELKSFTSRQEIEDLGPESYSLIDPLGKYEYLRLTKEGGRRIALDDLRRAPKNSTPHEELSDLFYRLSRSGEFTVRYNIEDKIPGVEVVFADKNQYVLSVCAEGGGIRALILENGAEYRPGAVNGEPEWREFSSDRPGDLRDEPSACRTSNLPSSAPKDATVIQVGRPAQSNESLFYATYGADGGIWKVAPGMEPVKIASGDYNSPVITPDGKWLVAIKTVDDGRDNVRQDNVKQLIRRSLRSGEELVVALAQPAFDYKLEYVAAHDEVLVLSVDHSGKIGPGDEGYLLDPVTGTIQPVNGEFRPMIHPISRALQSAGAPNLFWAAIYDREKRATKFGRYDSKKFVFTPLLEFPELTLSSHDIWVDANGGKIWLVYQGHLLRAPLPAQTR
jgi:HEAT repeats